MDSSLFLFWLDLSVRIALTPILRNFGWQALQKRWMGSGANFIPDSEISLGGSKGVDGLSAARSDSLMRH